MIFVTATGTILSTGAFFYVSEGYVAKSSWKISFISYVCQQGTMSQETYVTKIPGPPVLDARLLRLRWFFLKDQWKNLPEDVSLVSDV